MSAVIPTPSPRDDDVAVEVHANGGAGDGSTAAAEESGATAGSTATTIQRKGSGSVSAAALQRLENRDSAKAMRTIFKSVAPDDDGSDDGTEYVVKLNNLHKTYLLGIGEPASDPQAPRPRPAAARVVVAARLTRVPAQRACRRSAASRPRWPKASS